MNRSNRRNPEASDAPTRRRPDLRSRPRSSSEIVRGLASPRALGRDPDRPGPRSRPAIRCSRGRLAARWGLRPRGLVRLVDLLGDAVDLLRLRLEVGEVELDPEDLRQHLQDRLGAPRVDEVAARLTHQADALDPEELAEAEEEAARADEAAARVVAGEDDAEASSSTRRAAGRSPRRAPGGSPRRGPGRTRRACRPPGCRALRQKSSTRSVSSYWPSGSRPW